MIIEYSACNSGGSWWLKDEDWIALETAGWWVEWGGPTYCHTDFSMFHQDPPICKSKEECKGHRRYETADQVKTRYLGALAREARKEFETPGEALREFERITKQDVCDDGCNCYGAPHSFSWENGYCSGDGCREYLDLPTASAREMAEELKKLKGG